MEFHPFFIPAWKFVTILPCTKPLPIMLSQPFGAGHKFLREQLINIWNSQFPKIPKVIMATKTRSDRSKALQQRKRQGRIVTKINEKHPLIV